MVAAIYLFGIADSPTSHIKRTIVELIVNGGGWSLRFRCCASPERLRVQVFLHWAFFQYILAQR